MKPRVFILFFFLFIGLSLYAYEELEPNDFPSNSGVLWAENGTHNGGLGGLDYGDFWKIRGVAGDSIVVTLSNDSTLVASYRDVNNNVLPSTFADGKYKITLSSATNIYVLISGINIAFRSYSFTISGQLYAGSSEIQPPSQFSIANGAVNVNSATNSMSWRWGDSSMNALWSFSLGASPNGLQCLNEGINNVSTREQSIAFPTHLAGNVTYYWKLEYSPFNNPSINTVTGSFSTGSYLLNIPLVDSFETGLNYFVSTSSNCDWDKNLSYHPDLADAITCEKTSGETGILLSSGSFNLNGYPAPYLEIKHACFMQAGVDKGFVEYSTNGGQNWYIMPASAYSSEANYSDTQNWFDKSSYEDWGGVFSYNTIQSKMKTEIFQLSSWSTASNFRIRFRAEWGENSAGNLWAIDYVKFWQHPPTIPVILYPSHMQVQTPTDFDLKWSCENAISYTVYLTNAESGTQTLTTAFKRMRLYLPTSTTYQCVITGHNQSGNSPLPIIDFIFSTNDYETSYVFDPVNVINAISIGDFQHSETTGGYYYFSDSTIQVSQGEYINFAYSGSNSYPIDVTIDFNSDYVFSDYETFELTPNQPRQIQVPFSAVPGITRARFIYHSMFSTGGEIEDYVLDILPASGVQVAANPIVFNTTLSGHPAELEYCEISPMGSAPLVIESVEVTGPDAEYFQLGSFIQFPITLYSGTDSLPIQYLPLSPGNHTATLVLHTNSVNPTFEVTLNGSAEAENLSGAAVFAYPYSHISVPGSVSFVSIEAVTIEGWIFPMTNSSTQCIFTKGIDEMEVYITSEDALLFKPTDGVYIESYYSSVPSTWSHFACVYSPQNSLGKIYVNGQDVTWRNTGTNPLSYPMMNSPAAGKIGMSNTGTYPFVGWLDELRIWERALTLQEIRENMHLLQDMQTPDLFANWRFNEPAGDIAYDVMNSHSGTILDYTTADRINTNILIGNGLSESATIENGSSMFSFPSLGVEISNVQTSNNHPITITKLISDPQRDVFSAQNWIIRYFDSTGGIATVSLQVQEDITTSLLPAQNFKLYGRSPMSSVSWSLQSTANSVNEANNILSFPQVPLYDYFYRIEWDGIPIPANVQIGKSSDNITLSWDAVPNCQGYRVYSSENPEGPFTTDESGLIIAESWTTSTTANSRFFRVVAVRGD